MKPPLISKIDYCSCLFPKCIFSAEQFVFLHRYNKRFNIEQLSDYPWNPFFKDCD